jgi:hypothetical protein
MPASQAEGLLAGAAAALSGADREALGSGLRAVLRVHVRHVQTWTPQHRLLAELLLHNDHLGGLENSELLLLAQRASADENSALALHLLLRGGAEPALQRAASTRVLTLYAARPELRQLLSADLIPAANDDLPQLQQTLHACAHIDGWPERPVPRWQVLLGPATGRTDDAPAPSPP